MGKIRAVLGFLVVMLFITSQTNIVKGLDVTDEFPIGIEVSYRWAYSNTGHGDKSWFNLVRVMYW